MFMELANYITQYLIIDNSSGFILPIGMKKYNVHVPNKSCRRAAGGFKNL